MKFSQLITLAEAAELGLSLVEKPIEIDRRKAAREAAYLESRKRLQARDLNRRRRSARTVRRESIRLALS